MQTLDVISVNLWSVLISLVNLFLLYLILKKFLYKPVKKTLEARKAAIDAQYSDAEEAKQAAAAGDSFLVDYVRVFDIKEK